MCVEDFHKSLGDGMILHVWNEAGQLFTLQQLKQILMGLRLYLIDGQRFYETRFKFWNGPVLPEILTTTLGGGELISEKVETGRVTSD